MIAATIQPCKRCGKPPVVMDAYYDDPYDARQHRYHVRCRNAECRAIARPYEDKGKAIQRWNYRYGIPKPEKPE
jgi:hypothetical protein